MSGRSSGDAAPEVEELRQNKDVIRRSARVAGLREFVTPTLEQVEHRRVELLTVVFAVAVGLAIGLVLLSSYGALPTAWLRRMGATGDVLRALVVLLTVAFSLYVFEKERALRRLSRALMDERVLTAALTSRLRDFSSLTEAGKAVLSKIELDDVLAVILRSASELLESDEGSVLLFDGDTFGVAAATGAASLYVGDRRPATQGWIGYVAARREPLLVQGGTSEEGIDWSFFPHETPSHSAMSIPLIAEEELLGVLNLSVTTTDRQYTEHDLRALSLFGEHAAIAVRHARVLNKERKLRAQVAEQDQIRNQLVGSMTHDLKSPLTLILGSAQVLVNADEDDLPHERRQELLEGIERQSKRLVRLVDQLLGAARSQAPDALSQTTLDLVTHITFLATTFANVHGRDIEVRPAAERLYVLADPEALDQVVSILLENACVHTPQGTSVRIELGSRDGSAEVRVSDDGPGMDPEQLRHLFEPFHRSSSKRGAGLGMFIASNLVRAMGGEIGVESVPGRGTSISFTLPVQAGQASIPA